MQRSTKIFALSFGLGFPSLGAFAKVEEKSLNIDAVKHYQVSIEKGLYAVRAEGKNVWTSPERAAFVVNSLYNAEAKEADLGFGSPKNPLDGSERIEFGSGERRIRGIERDKDTLIFLDSEKLQLLSYKESEKKWLRPKDIVLDLVKPARDARGEATRKEQTALISRLRAALSKVKGQKDIIAGMASIPPSWKDRDGSLFLLWLRIPEAPLLTLKCTDGEACVAQRSCFVKGLSPNEIKQVSGIARDGDRILLGLPEQGKVMELKGRNCFSQKAATAFRIPPRIKAMTNIFVDESRNLWMTTAIPDDYTSATLFVWAKNNWE